MLQGQPGFGPGGEGRVRHATCNCAGPSGVGRDGSGLDRASRIRSDSNMASLCGAVRGGMACLAACLTLLSGTPHFDCLCPDGHLKLFCSSFSSGSSSCCCRGSCCGAGAGEKKPARCCCCHGRHARGHTTPGSRVSAPACRKTLSRSETATLPDSAANGSHVTATSAVVALVTLPGVLPADGGGYRLSWQSYDRPPPTNLVIALRHLTI